MAAPVVGAGIENTVKERATQRPLVGMFPLQGQGYGVNGYGIGPI